MSIPDINADERNQKIAEARAGLSGLEFKKGGVYRVQAGDYFELVLLDGTVLSVDCTPDDFGICRQDGTVAYTTPLSKGAKENDAELAVTSGCK